MKPLLKWVGSKRWIAPEVCHLIKDRWSPEKNYYIEPFFGGGSVFFELEPPRAIILDKLAPLMEFYRVVASSPVTVYEKCVEEVDRGMRSKNYLAARKRFNVLLQEMTYDAEFAAIFIYLNKLGYNGLWRQNQRGEYNVPYGRHSSLKAPQASDLIQASGLLKRARIDIEGRRDTVFDWLDNARKGDVVFADPPYMGTFNGWDGFSSENAKNETQFHLRLSIKLASLVERGVHVIVMNSAKDFIYRLYSSHFTIKELNHLQNIAPETGSRANAPQYLMVSKC